jgi:protein-tyrosine phosphatase
MTKNSSPFHVLFVCTGNICRSPTAEGVFRSLVDHAGLDDAVVVESAGTIAFHIGEPPDQRTQAAAAARGVDLSKQKARQIEAADFTRFDIIVAMDRSHHRELLGRAPDGSEDRIRLFMDYAPRNGIRDVPDPYYGGIGGVRSCA